METNYQRGVFYYETTSYRGKQLQLKPALITMAKQNEFTKPPIEDPNQHLGRIYRMANTIKLNEVNLDVIKL